MYLRALARDLGHLVDFRESGLVALNAVAADAHGDLLLHRPSTSPLTSWAWGKSGHASDSNRANIEVNNLFILRAQSYQRFDQISNSEMAIISTARISPSGVNDFHYSFMKFQGSQNYVATQDLMLAVNAAITLQRPLLVKGEPGTGKTMLAEEVAEALGMPLLQWHIKSTTKAQQGLYEYDAVSRLRDSQLGDERVQGHPQLHRARACCGRPSRPSSPVALLIDEIDKADIEFPNDLLREIDRMEFYCYETRELVRPSTGRWCSSPRTTKRNCPTPFCAAASSTTSSSPTPTPCARSSTCTSPISRRSC
jgi:hypothetical protein